MDNEYIQNLLEEIPSGGSHGGHYESQLSKETTETLKVFTEWLKDQGMTNASAASYKSYMAKAMALKSTWKELTSDQRSAARKFAAFLEDIG